MAKRFFNTKVKKRRKSYSTIIIIVGCTLAILVLVILILNASKNKMPSNAKVVIRKEVSVELNSKLPDKTLFFSELENVPESKISIDYKDTDLTVPDSYQVIVKVYNKEYTSTLTVIDNVAPELEVKDFSIHPGDHYEAESFVKYCKDNSKKQCIFEFYDKATDAKGNPIDYSNYSKVGKYRIQIVAKDETGNVTQPMEAELTITKSETSNPTECEFGKATIAKGVKLTVNVTTDECALDLNSYKNQELISKTDEYVEKEKTKLKDEFKKYNLNVKDVFFNATIDPVLNATGDGLVGYLVTITVSVEKIGEKEVIELYTVNADGSRSFTTNKYNLK